MPRFRGPKRGVRFVAVLVPLVVLVAAALAPTAAASSPGPSGNGVVPIAVEGNPTCSTFVPGGFEFKDENGPFTGVWSNGYITITYSSPDGVYLDWSSTRGIDAVFMKGGPGGNLYSYSPESTGDTHLHSPEVSSGLPAEISHVSFCYDYELDVTKTADTKFDREYRWSIDKSVSPATHDLFLGDTGSSTYDVKVRNDGFVDRNFAVGGIITVSNATPLPVLVAGVFDFISGFGPAPVGPCFGGPFLAPFGGTMTCFYSSPLPDASPRINTATAISGSPPVKDGTGKADVDFSTAGINHINQTVNVSDTYAGPLGPVSAPAGGSFSYSRDFTCNGDEGPHDNIATIRETRLSDSASVSVRCYELGVEKTAATSYTRTFDWGIRKDVAPADWDLFEGDTGTSGYTVSVSKDAGTDSAFAVAGTITVSNPAPMDAHLTGVTDEILGAGSAAVSCPSTTVPAGGTLACTYSASLADATDRVNEATATLENTPSGTTGFTGSAAVDFGDPTTLVNDTVTVNDTNGESWSFSDSGFAAYSRTFACGADAGRHENVASIAETGASASASVDVRCHELSVAKTADTSLTRTWTWTIDKSADTAGPLTLSAGQAFTVNYSVQAAATSADSDWAVQGRIKISNPAPVPATILSVSDVVSPAVAASVDCGGSFPLTIPAGPGSGLECTYETALPDASTQVNTATATRQAYAYDSLGGASPAGTNDESGSATVDFSSAAVTEIDENADITDSFAGALGTASAPGPAAFAYSRTLVFGSDACGDNVVDNVAAFTTGDTGATGSDSWSIPVTVACGEGCSLTPGYWKTHSEVGPAPYDDTWLLVGPLGVNETFLHGQTYYQALSTPPAGNAWYILSRAYVAAYMNGLNGADTSVISGQLATAYTLLSGNAPTSNIKGQLRNQFLAVATILDDYNNGLIGPGHCSEDGN